MKRIIHMTLLSQSVLL